MVKCKSIAVWYILYDKGNQLWGKKLWIKKMVYLIKLYTVVTLLVNWFYKYLA